jgi:hypothetical protein
MSEQNCPGVYDEVREKVVQVGHGFEKHDDRCGLDHCALDSMCDWPGAMSAERVLAYQANFPRPQRKPSRTEGAP